MVYADDLLHVMQALDGRLLLAPHLCCLFHTAQERCQADGGGLASFVNLEELTSVKQLAKSYWDAYNVDPDYESWGFISEIYQDDTFWIGLLGKDTDPRDTWANRQPHDFYADVSASHLRLGSICAHTVTAAGCQVMVMTMRLPQRKGHAWGRFLHPSDRVACCFAHTRTYAGCCTQVVKANATAYFELGIGDVWSSCSRSYGGCCAHVTARRYQKWNGTQHVWEPRGHELLMDGCASKYRWERKHVPARAGVRVQGACVSGRHAPAVAHQ